MMKRAKALALLGLVVANPVFAYTTSKATYMNTIWTTINDFLTGVGGLVLAAILIGMGVYTIFARGQTMWGLGALIGGVAIKLIPTIAQGMGFNF